MLKYTISFLFTAVVSFAFSQKQENTVPLISSDSIVYTTNYGLRLGVDISKPITKLVKNDYTGLEFVADYRISKRYYIAAEIGTETAVSTEDYTNSTVKGNYIRLGFNYNAYDNWLDMNNEVFAGLRYGFATFNQTLNSYTPNVNTTYFPAQQINVGQIQNGLTAHWTEFMVGIKVETLKNLFVGISGSYKILLTVKDPDNFKSLYAPGFNRIFESNSGFGFNYTLSYLIPFAKK